MESLALTVEEVMDVRRVLVKAEMEKFGLKLGMSPDGPLAAAVLMCGGSQAPSTADPWSPERAYKRMDIDLLGRRKNSVQGSAWCRSQSRPTDRGPLLSSVREGGPISTQIKIILPSRLELCRAGFLKSACTS